MPIAAIIADSRVVVVEQLGSLHHHRTEEGTAAPVPEAAIAAVNQCAAFCSGSMSSDHRALAGNHSLLSRCLRHGRFRSLGMSALCLLLLDCHRIDPTHIAGSGSGKTGSDCFGFDCDYGRQSARDCFDSRIGTDVRGRSRFRGHAQPFECRLRLGRPAYPYDGSPIPQ